jgi:hypothetical protein
MARFAVQRGRGRVAGTGGRLRSDPVDNGRPCDAVPDPVGGAGPAGRLGLPHHYPAAALARARRASVLYRAGGGRVRAAQHRVVAPGVELVARLAAAHGRPTNVAHRGPARRENPGADPRGAGARLGHENGVSTSPTRSGGSDPVRALSRRAWRRTTDAADPVALRHSRAAVPGAGVCRAVQRDDPRDTRCAAGRASAHTGHDPTVGGGPAGPMGRRHAGGRDDPSVRPDELRGHRVWGSVLPAPAARREYASGRAVQAGRCEHDRVRVHGR